VATLLVMLFVAAFGFSGVATWAVLSQPVDAGIEARLDRETQTLVRLYGSRPLDEAIHEIRTRERRAAGLHWRMAEASGAAIAGDLPEGAVYRLGLTSVASGPPHDLPQVEDEAAGEEEEGDSSERLRVLTIAWPDGKLLSVGEDLGRMPEVRRQFLRTFLLTSGAALMIALGLVLTFASRLLGRIEVIARTADAVSGEDMGARVPMRGAGRGDDIDRLASSVNQMLDRIAGLLASIRQVSDDVAHDLRTPLAHLKQRIETALNGPPDMDAYRAALEGASDKIDEVLATFEALLAIARLEAGSQGPHFLPMDLSQVAEAVVEAFRPSAEDGGREILLSAHHPLPIRGERALITQMLANLVENALIHTPRGSTVEVRAERLGATARLVVEDDGPGVGDEERARIFERFFRVDRSRTTPGSGLGLSLAAAVAAAHGATIKAEDAVPGLRIHVDFPLARDDSAG
jgi:signal transduction histidine kinase